MHLTFPSKIDQILKYIRVKYMPKTLFFRTMLLIFVPLIVVQIVSIIAFFDGSWGRVGRRLSGNLTSNMAFVMQLAQAAPENFDEIRELSARNYDLQVKYYDNNEKHEVIRKVRNKNKMITGFLEESLKKEFPEDIASIYLKGGDLVVFVETPKGLYEFMTGSKNIFSTSIFGFMAWMVGTSLLLFIVAVGFLRIQVRSIADLAEAAEEFGKGVDNKKFKPYGSSEVRKAGIAFIKMKERILRQISERTQMLAGVSHDLRTPLTRMRLQLALLPDDKKEQGGLDKEEFLQDVSEMEKMLEGYLSFVSGEGGEPTDFVDLNEMILSIINKFRTTGKALVRYSTSDQVSAVKGREQALKRALSNIIGNAFNYGTTIAVNLEGVGNKVEITVDDDGPGIPEDKREDVFKAFYRLDESRNKETGGVGLGLSIAKDVISSHGGKIELNQSPMGGLRVLISIPL
ncbi:MAG: two-component sensor histidine kinase [Alphaproteobacteria bacterium]|nr:two-component sensor histidine kinase [Alphaproteobacteria bacterium]